MRDINLRTMQLNKVYHGDFLTNTLPDKSVQLIIADPPYFEVKGEFDFIWKSFDDYLKDVERWAIECKRLLADNGTLFWYGDAKKIAYSQIIFDKYFSLINSLVWENTNDHKQQIRFNKDLRSFAPLTERILMYSNEVDMTGLEYITEEYIKPKNPFSIYLREEFKRAKVNNKEISKLFPSKTGGLTGCVSNWLNGDNIITEEQYLKIREYLNNEYLRKEYEDLRKEYEDLRKEYEDLRRPFNNSLNLGDVIRMPNYDTSKYNHATVKPEKLTRALILTCSRPNDLVFVPFAGSGTECAMSAKEGRNFIGFDVDAKYVKMSQDRADKILKSPTLFI